MILKLRLHLTRSHNITTIALRIRSRNSRSSHTPILTLSKHFRINVNIRIRSSQLKTINITTMSTRTHILHNTNLSMTIRSNQTKLLNKPVSFKFNIKHSTTLTRSSISCVEPKNTITKLHTSHSFPSPLVTRNVYNTRITLTFSEKSQRESIIIHTKSIGKNLINLSRLR